MNKEKLINSLINNFSLENLSELMHELDSSFITNVEDLSIYLKDSYSQFSDLVKLGESENKKQGYENLILFACKYNGELTERSSKKSQFDIAKTVLKQDFKDGAIFVFYDEIGNFRFSFIKRFYGDTKQKFTNWKRYTYFVSKAQTNRTFIERIKNYNFTTLDSILEAFSVEPLNIEFYKKIQNIFYKLIGGEVGVGKNKIVYTGLLKLPNTTDRNIKKQFGVRLVGRIIFCWFLKYKKSTGNVSLIPEDWLSNDGSNNYYHSKLEVLFFEILNKKIDERSNQLKNDNKLIPFLNGGLFEPLNGDDNDYYNGKPNYGLDISDGWFIELFDILQQYNFTIDENSINDAEVSIDPEMLGRIFENLLAEIDPNADTASKKSVKKATGSFYTPREIVDYMVEESLVLYLYNQTNLEKNRLKKLFTDDDIDFNDTQKLTIIDSLSDVKILDPACGSGAFPMGALHKCVSALRKIDPDAIAWKKRQLDNIKNPVLKKEVKNILDNSNSEYARKIGILQNCIYGVDIQPIAIEISKLRCFLSLIVEEEIDDSKENRGVLALPNLDFKFITANSLNELSNNGKLETTLATELLPEFEKMREDYLQSHGDEKIKLKKEFQDMGLKIQASQVNFDSSIDNRVIQLTSWNPFENKSSTWFDPDWMFGINQFDIIIGNPPYGGTKISDNVKTSLGLESKDPYGAFIARYINSNSKVTPLKNKGVLAYIVSDTFMTIVSHFKLRKMIMDNTIHKMIRVHPDTFKATVNTAIILLERNEENNAESDNNIIMADFTNISIHENYLYFYNILQDTQIGLENSVTISNSDYAIYSYKQKLIRQNSNLPFFIASPKIFNLMQNIGNEKSMFCKMINGKFVDVRIVKINDIEINVTRLGDFTDVKQGLATGDNKSYLFQNPEARGTYRNIDDYKNYLLNNYDLDKIRKNEELRFSIIENGINKNDPNNERYFNGKFIIPYDKGGESNAEGGWLPNYYVPTNYFIDWSEESLARMKSYTIAQRIIDNKENKEILNHYKNQIAGVFRNTNTYFKSSIGFSDTGVYAPTFRISSSSVYDVMSMSIFVEKFTENLISILPSKLIRYIIKHYINHSIHTQVEGVKPIPISINTTLKITELSNSIIEKQLSNPRYDYASHEQIEIDKIIYETYGLNKEDIEEVENWYARRYPKLSQAQKKNLRDLGKSDDYLELYGLK